MLSLVQIPIWAQRPTTLHEQLVYSGIDFDQINMDEIVKATSHPVIITIGGASFRGTIGPDANALTKQRISAETDNAVKQLMDETGINMGFLQRMKTLENELKELASKGVEEKQAKLYQELLSSKNMLTMLSYVLKAGSIYYSPLGVASTVIDNYNGRASGGDVASSAFQTAASEIAGGRGQELENTVLDLLGTRGKVIGTINGVMDIAGSAQNTLDFLNAGYDLAKYLDETAGISLRDKNSSFAQYWTDIVRLDAFYHAVPRRTMELLAKKYDLGWKIECNTWYMNPKKSLFQTHLKQAWHFSCNLKRVSGEQGSIFGYRGVFQGSMNIDIYHITGDYDKAFMDGTLEKTELVQALRQAPLDLSDNPLVPTTLVKYLSSSDFIVDTSGDGKSDSTYTINEGLGESNVLVDLELGQLSDNTVFNLSHLLSAKVTAGAYVDGVLSAPGIIGKADATIDITAEMQSDKRVFVLYGMNQKDQSFAQVEGKVFHGSWDKVVEKTTLMTDRDIFSDLNGPAQMLIE